ncbi:molybdenum cofactor guanylyltransferase MobA [Rhodoligotrophos defluvii]|uniref:molybdenum cofactor guanylyltransferase MobA n=1 Tax=Rhodoligotrophos defluvii TaxID=2561934 RepID=UPI0010CA0426|nr:molybdenum cofactor guanylyltransferase MobA [Rhodoligotrophos defluvii]
MTRDAVVGVILAGGRGSRLGGVDKALVDLGGEPLIAHGIRRLQPQVAALLINANGDAQRFRQFGLPVVPDENQASRAGPLGGLLAGMRATSSLVPDTKWLVSLPCDTPFPPADLVEQLLRCAGDALVMRAASGGRVHHLVAAWRLSLFRDLEQAIASGMRKVAAWVSRHEPHVGTVEFPTEPFDPFFNINRPEDLRQAALILSSQPERQSPVRSG